MYIEDIIDKLVGFGGMLNFGSHSILPSYDKTLLESFSNQLLRGLGFTEKQSIIALRILTRHQDKISLFLKTDVRPFLETPQYKYTRRVISPEKSVKVETVEYRNTKVFRVKFPYDEKLVEQIKKYRDEARKQRIKASGFVNFPIADWNAETKTWDFEIYEENLLWIFHNLGSLGFTFDDEVISFKNDIETVQNHLENYVPMVVFDENRFRFVNTHPSIPQPNSNDILEVLFQAKKYGIFTWDENIEAAIADNSVKSVTKAILRDSKAEGVDLNNIENPLDCLSDVVNYSKRLLVIIPGGSELELLKTFYEFFTNLGISTEKMTVLFRLDSSAGKICNEFVKDKKLNNSITEDVKIFFVSAKVPKPLISSNYEIDAILNLGNNSAHYTVKNLLKNHHCVVTYTIDRSQKRNHFAGL